MESEPTPPPFCYVCSAGASGKQTGPMPSGPQLPPSPPGDGNDALSRIRHPKIRELYRYWLVKRGGRRAPARVDIDPVELRGLLPHISLFDVVEPGPRLRFRLVGTAVTEIAGEATGKFIDELVPAHVYARLHEQYVDIVRNLVGRYTVADLEWQGRPYLRYHRLLLPLSDDQRSANLMLGIGFMDQQRHRPADVALDRMQPAEPMIDERIDPDGDASAAR
jgi:hypothetical protein